MDYAHTDLDHTTALNFEEWSSPILINTVVYEDRIELIYKQEPNFTWTISGYILSPQPDPKIFKIVYSCKNGKWHESDKIEGEYISARDETYEF